MSEFSPGEVSKMLGLPGATLRRYVATFGDLLSPRATLKRGRTFTETDVAIFSQIRQHTESGKTLEEIRPLLANILPDHDQGELPQDENQTAATALVVINNLAQQINTRLTDQASQIDEIRAQHAAQIAALQEQIDRLAGEVESKKRRSWWDRLFKRE